MSFTIQCPNKLKANIKNYIGRETIFITLLLLASPFRFQNLWWMWEHVYFRWDIIWCSNCYCNKGGKRRLNDRKLIVVSLIPYFKLIWNLYCRLIFSLSFFNQASLQNHFKYKMTSFYVPTNGNIEFQKVFDLLLWKFLKLKS